MNPSFNKIIAKENLLWAWNKVKYYYENEADFIPDIEEFNEFEINLDEKINIICDELINDKYNPSKIMFMPLPKEKDKKNVPQYRQFFYIPIRDQVVWVAIINVIGPKLDIEMPFWSFGNRLYFPVWYENENVKKKLKCGRYRPSAKKIYRTWSQSWPLFRKAIKLTIKKMSKTEIRDLDDEELLEHNYDYPKEYIIKYIKKGYWKKKSEVYWGSIDFTKFYPKISHDLIISNIEKYAFENTLFDIDQDKEKTIKLISKMLEFRLEDINSSDAYGDKVGFEDLINHNGIPTGLIVGGFLSNIALLNVDKEVEKLLNASHEVAHFRYVDDHVFLGSNVEDLIRWIKTYIDILSRNQFADILNMEKTEPKELGAFITEDNCKNEKKENVAQDFDSLKNACKLDSQNPAPLMTLTLMKMSNLNHKNSILMKDEEKIAYKDDLIYMLLTDIPNKEIKSSTRISWASSMLNRLIPTIRFYTSEIYQKNIEIMEGELKIRDCRKNIEYKIHEDKTQTILDGYMKIKSKLNSELKSLKNKLEEEEKKLFSQIFDAYCKTVKENYSKPRIWSNAITFCKNTGYNGIGMIFNALNELYVGNFLDIKGFEYIKATLYKQISKDIISAINISESPEVQYRNKCRAKVFLKNITSTEYKFIVNDNFLENQYVLFKISKKYALDYLTDSALFVQANQINAYSYQLLKSLSASYFSIEGECNSLYANLCMAKTITRSFKEKMNTGVSTIDSIINEENMIREYELKTNENADVNLLELIEIVRKSKYGVLDTELFALNIVKELAKYFNSCKTHSITNMFELNNISKMEDLVLSPLNFVIKTDAGKLFRYKTIKTMSKFFTEKKHEITYNKETILKDMRYLPQSSKKTSAYLSQKYFLGIILCKLITKNTRFKDSCNIVANNVVSYTVINELNNHGISSWTRAIISSCLSERKFETKIADLIFPYQKEGRDDTLKDPIELINMEELILTIDIAISKLKFFHADAGGDAIIQLVPVRLEQYNAINNPFYKGDV